MYIANYNLNTEISLAGTSLLVPTTVLINQTNALDGNGTLGLMANECASELDCQFMQPHRYETKKCRSGMA